LELPIPPRGRPGWDLFERGGCEKPFSESDNPRRRESYQNSGERVPTINEKYDGQKHPETGIPYNKDIVKLPDGTEVQGVFPEFEAVFEMQLEPNPDGSYTGDRLDHEKQANEKLREQVEKDPELRAKFTEEQLEQIRNGETPDGYTWHHHQEPGKMQLVDSAIHRNTRHTGGYALWGKQEEIKNA
jgi:hypothetical protein